MRTSAPMDIPTAQMTPLDALLSRYSQGIKHLRAPGPDAAQLQTLVRAALRAPDHGELVPFRLVAVQGTARERLADLFAAHAQTKGKDAEGMEIERERALKAPLILAVLARIDLGHPLVPAHEQWMCVGGRHHQPAERRSRAGFCRQDAQRRQSPGGGDRPGVLPPG